MDLAPTTAERALAAEFRSWLADNFTAPPPLSSLAQEIAWGRAWQARLAAGRWVGVDWPAACGGRGASPLELALINLEYGRAGAPQLVGRVGLNLAGPTLLAWGTEEQRRRWLPAILSADELWCQLFSEPEAGSDLGALRTRAVPVPGGWRLTGRKIWTSYAPFARWGVCLARTERICCFVVDMTAPGVAVRPLTQLTGEAEFSEVTLDETFVPAENLIGPEGEGWRVAATTLAHERGTNFPIKEQTVHEVRLARLLAAARLDDPVVADEVAAAYVELRLLTLANLRTLSRLGRGVAPGPESSVVKLRWTRMTQHLSKLWADQAPADPDARRQFLWSFAAGIAGGTSEIQRTIIAERILGLPRG